MLMRIALVYVLAVTSTVFAFALYWQEGRLTSIQDSFLRASNELTSKTAEADKLRELKTAAEERAFFAEARLRDVATDQQSAAGQIANVRRIQAEAEAALSKAQAATRDETEAKAAALARVNDLEAKLNRLTAELESLRGQPAGASAKPSASAAPSPAPSPLASAPPAADAATLKQKLMIEPDPTVKSTSYAPLPTTTGAIPAAKSGGQPSQQSEQASRDQTASTAAPSESETQAAGKPEVKEEPSKAADRKPSKSATAKRKPRVVEKVDSYLQF